MARSRHVAAEGRGQAHPVKEPRAAQFALAGAAGVAFEQRDNGISAASTASSAYAPAAARAAGIDVRGEAGAALAAQSQLCAWPPQGRGARFPRPLTCLASSVRGSALPIRALGRRPISQAILDPE
jgi:hypothetical protein